MQICLTSSNYIFTGKGPIVYSHSFAIDGCEDDSSSFSCCLLPHHPLEGIPDITNGSMTHDELLVSQEKRFKQTKHNIHGDIHIRKEMRVTKKETKNVWLGKRNVDYLHCWGGC